MLEHRGLKAGGTASERAKRLWSVKGLSYEDIPKKLKAKQVVLPSSSENKPPIPSIIAPVPVTAGKKALAWLEFQITRLSELIIDVVHKTRSHAEKQQTRSAEEKQRELLAEEQGVVDVGDEEEDDEETPVHNPLEAPSWLGWKTHSILDVSLVRTE